MTDVWTSSIRGLSVRQKDARVLSTFRIRSPRSIVICYSSLTTDFSRRWHSPCANSKKRKKKYQSEVSKSPRPANQQSNSERNSAFESLATVYGENEVSRHDERCCRMPHPRLQRRLMSTSAERGTYDRNLATDLARRE